MEWQEAVEIVAAGARHHPYRELCQDSNPNHEVWRKRAIAKATGTPVPGRVVLPPAPPPAAPAAPQEPAGGSQASFPPIWQQAANFVQAGVQHAATGFQEVPDEEKERRFQICRACDQYDAPSDRCKKCGCWLATKRAWLSSRCPLDKW